MKGSTYRIVHGVWETVCYINLSYIITQGKRLFLYSLWIYTILTKPALYHTAGCKEVCREVVWQCSLYKQTFETLLRLHHIDSSEYFRACSALIWSLVDLITIVCFTRIYLHIVFTKGYNWKNQTIQGPFLLPLD